MKRNIPLTRPVRIGLTDTGKFRHIYRQVGSLARCGAALYEAEPKDMGLPLCGKCLSPR